MKVKRMKEKEKKHSKKVIMLVIVLLLLAIIGTAGYFIYNSLNNSKAENPLLEDKDALGMKLKNITIEEREGIYVFKAQVENTLKEKFEKQSVQIIFRDETDKKAVKYQYVIEDLERGEMQDIEIQTSEPLNEFYTFEIKRVV